MGQKKESVIVAEIKISIAINSWTELQNLIGKIREDCKNQDYKLNVNLEENFFKPVREPPVEFDGRMAEQYRKSKQSRL